MSSYDKLVKLACKPKPNPPKSKYLDPIVAATWSEDGAIHDVCKALSPRLREPNAIVVFKALIVLHYIIRNGSTDNILSYLANSDVLRLRNVSDGNWEGYNAPEHLQNYATYLHTRIRAYRELKHDAIRVQSESNRDLRNQNSIEEDNIARGSRKAREAPKLPASGPTRSKTVMGRKLRMMTVEKGLLRETKIVQQMIGALLECRFYLADLEDELTVAALRMLVMDLLILFQAGNEGVINVLEHYFEMSHIDAKDALKIYRQFCAQAEGVVEYLGVAKKLQNLLNVSIPNLKHAPVSLVGALEEYLNDSNFEQNRIEYKANKDAASRGNTPTSSSKSATTSSKEKGKATASTPPVPAVPAASSSASKKTAQAAVDDLLSAIEEEQPMNFDTHANGTPAIAFPQSAPNPFIQMGLATGQPFPAQQFVPPVTLQMQPIGFLLPQQTAVQSQLQPNPFGPSPQLPSSNALLQPLASNSVLQQVQPTGANFLRPQATGAVNPFRQSMLVPQTTGAALFTPQAMQTQIPGSSTQIQQPSSAGPASTASSSFLSPTATAGTSSSTSSFFTNSTMASPLSQPSSAPAFKPPARPASTPLTSFNTFSQQQQPSNSPLFAQPVKTHHTGSRNPFGSIVTEQPPPVPKQPTLMELSRGIGSTATTPSFNYPGNPPSQPVVNGSSGIFNPAAGTGGSDMASVASSFTFSKNAPGTGAINVQNTSTTTSASMFSDSLASSPKTQFTGATTLSNASTNPSSSSNLPTLQPQTTGFVGLKAFKPTSSFGAALLDSLPPVSIPSPTSSNPTGGFFPPGSFTPASGFGTSTLNAQPTDVTKSTLGVGLRPQMTGGGAANPFRASMATQTLSGPFGSGMSASSAPPLPLRGGFGANPLPTTAPNLSFPMNSGIGPAFGGSFGSLGTQSAPAPSQPSGPSLI